MIPNLSYIAPASSGINLPQDEPLDLSMKKPQANDKKPVGSTSSGRNATQQEVPLDRSMKRKGCGDATVDSSLSEKKSKVITPENHVSGRNSPEPSGSGQENQLAELLHQTDIDVLFPQLYQLNQLCQNSHQKIQCMLQQLTDHKLLYLLNKLHQRIEVAFPSEKNEQQNRNENKLRFEPTNNINKQSMNAHRPTHAGEKLYKCEQCDFASEYQKSLKRHQKNHTDETSFGCDLCGYFVNRLDHFKRHLLSGKHRKAKAEGIPLVKDSQPNSTTALN